VIRARNIFGDTAALAASAAATTLIRGIVALALVRYLGPTDYGALAAAIALATLACHLVDLGTGYHTVRQVSRAPDQAPTYLGNALVTTALMLVVMTAFLNGAVWSFEYPHGARILMPLLGVGVLLQAARAPLHGALRALGRVGRCALSELSGALVLALMCALGILWVRPLPFFGLMHLATGLGGMAVAAALVAKLVRPRPRLAEVPAYVRASLPFAASSVFYVIYGQIDTVMLANMRSTPEVGIYSAAFKLVALMNLVPVAMSAALLPAAFALGESNASELRRIFRLNIRYLAAVSVPLAAAIWIFAAPIRVLLMGPDYAGVEPLLRILAVQVVLRYLSYAPADALYALGKERQRVAIQGLASLVNVALNLVLIPRAGPAGAALATVVTELLVLLLMAWQAARCLGGIGLARPLLRPLGAALLPVATLLILQPRQATAITAALALAAAAYLVGLLALGFFDRSERRWLRRARKRIHARVRSKRS